MLRKVVLSAAFLCVFGASTTAAADVPPTDPAPDPAVDPPKKKLLYEPPPEADDGGDGKAEAPKADGDDKTGDDKAGDDKTGDAEKPNDKDGLCSIGGSDSGLMGLAAAIMLLSGLALRRREP